jgi:hypothetical protein
MSLKEMTIYQYIILMKNDKNNMLTIAAIDIGWRNLSIYVEEFDPDILRCLKGTESYKEMVYLNGFRLYWDLVDIAREIKVGRKCPLSNELFVRLTEYLDSILYVLDQCDIILLEQQRSRNFKAGRSLQHIHSYLINRYRRSVEIIILTASAKTQWLDAPVKMTKYVRKKWTPMKTLKILEKRNDKKSIFFLDYYRKNDDLGDTFCMVQAYKMKRIY